MAQRDFDLELANIRVVPVSYAWTGTGTGNAPGATSVEQFSLGVDKGGTAAATVYWVIAGAWVSTGATVTNLFGG
jgi:hypothetical protein